MRETPRIVLDTNVVLSALVFAQGGVTTLRHAWQDGLCHPLVSRATLAELVSVLGYPKFKLSADDQRELLSDYLPYCATVRIPARPPTTPPCRDPHDVPFLQLALVGKAEYLVTGDRDLLELANRFACRILTPAEWLQAFSRVEDAIGGAGYRGRARSTADMARAIAKGAKARRARGRR